MNRLENALEIFKKNKGVIRTGDAKRLGINENTIRELYNKGLLVRLDRGLYRLSSLPNMGNSDFILITKKIPKAVICLVSALYHYELTTQIPSKVYIALPREEVQKPKLAYPPIEVTWYSKNSYSIGIDMMIVEEIPVRIYSPEKTIADIYKFQNKVGKAIALEALQLYFQNSKTNINQLIHYAKINRVYKKLMPHIEALA